jgi:predicted dehydrogenase/threonine dehydrogenase-like Zn-dependent dehydrogenase
LKQVLQYRRSGQTRVVDVPAPLAPAGGVLVRNHWSLISPGTERMLVEAGGANLINTARQRPDLVKQVLEKASRDGVRATLETVRSRLDVAIPLGYSCAGTVIDVGEAAQGGFERGERVACAGAGQANHAELVAVPRNLTVRVPDGVSLEDAAFVTVGAIALHGVRQADIRIGEACVVIGLGLVGQLTVQVLKAAGARVFGIDLATERVELARSQGADAGCLRSEASLVEQVMAFSNGRGADSILVAAASSSSDAIQLAPQLARDRAVVVAVGSVGLDVPRNAYYEKELELRLSRSYGPGRYDATYEQQGVDYPIGYVRWTEQRNMQAFLELIAQGKVQPSALVTHRVPIAEAERAYELVTGDAGQPALGILLEYPSEALARPSAVSRQPAAVQRRVELSRVEQSRSREVAGAAVRLGVIGAGSFARSVLLPELRRLDVDLRGVATASGPSAHQTGSRFGFGFATTDWREVLEDRSLDAVLIATRHDLHAGVAAEALRRDLAVFVEKPLALDEVGLAQVMDAWRSSGRVLQVGFNRRFAPAFRQLKGHFAARRAPLVMAYRVNAGAVAPSSWVVDPVQGGGRLIGEVCHMVDLLAALAEAPVASVFCQPLPNGAQDDLLLSLTFAEGSLGSIVYASGGDRALPKERLEVFCGGRSAVLDDFQALELHAGGRATRSGSRQDKGHAAELRAFLAAVRRGGPSPLSPEDAAHVTRVTFAAVQSARSGLPVGL